MRIDYWRAAGLMAHFFSRALHVKAIGLFGSLARGETANDVDLILFSNLLIKQFPPYRRGKYAIDLEKGIPSMLCAADYDILKILISHFILQGITFDVQVFPEKLDEGFLESIRRLDPDPKFLWNVSKDILFWDTSKSVFAKNQNLWQEVFGATDLSPRTTLEIVGGIGAGEGSCLIVAENGFKAVLDCGADPTSTLLSIQKTVGRLLQFRPDFVVLTHFHYDHFGALPYYLKELKDRNIAWPVIIATQETFGLLCSRLETMRKIQNFPRLLGGGFLSAGRRLYRAEKTDKIELIPNLHSVPGSCSVLVKGKKNVFYTGDFFDISLGRLPLIDLLVIDSTCALKDEPRDSSVECQARKNVWSLVEETLNENSQSKAYIALFSTQLDRAVWLYKKTLQLTGRKPNVDGSSLFWNMKTYHPEFFSEDCGYRVALMTGVWAQGESTSFAQSALVRLSNGVDRHGIKKGDIIILSASIPVWNASLTEQIKFMCIRLKGMGARVVVDESSPEDWGRFAERKKIHQGGHANFPEIANAIRKLKPRKALPFHASVLAREKIARFCREEGIEVVSPRSLITI